MPRPIVRFTVRRIMALVSLTAIGLAVVRHAATTWGPGEVMTIAPTVFLATNVLAWFQGARRQVFWLGFGLSGIAYLALSLASPLSDDLPTAWLLEALHDRVYANRPVPSYDDGFDGGGTSARVHRESFKHAGQSALSLLVALLGGFAALVLFPPRADDGVMHPPDGSLLKPGWREAAGSEPASS